MNPQWKFYFNIRPGIVAIILGMLVPNVVMVLPVDAQTSPQPITQFAQGDGDDEADTEDPTPSPSPLATDVPAGDAETEADAGDENASGTVATDQSDGPEASASDDSGEDESDPVQLAAVAAAGLVAGIAGTTVIMRRRIKRLQAELREAQIVIQAVKPAGQRRRPRQEAAAENSARSIAAAKKIGGQSLLRTGQSREAYAMFLDAIEQDEDDDEAWLWAGIAAMKLKQYEVAQQTLLQARTLGNEKAEDALRKLKELIDKRDRIRAITTAAVAEEEPDFAPLQAPPQRKGRKNRAARQDDSAAAAKPELGKPRSMQRQSKDDDPFDDLDAEPDFDF
jgi:tetratricopeptide (TPR) repeat protein